MRFFIIFSSIHFPFLFKKLSHIIPQEFYEAVDYLKIKYNKTHIRTEDIYLNILSFSIILSLISSCILSSFINNISVSILIFVILTIVIYLSIYYGILGDYEYDKLIVCLYYFMMFEDIRLAYFSTKSFIEAIRFAALGTYPVISNLLRNYLKNIINGIDIESKFIGKGNIDNPLEKLGVDIEKILLKVKLEDTYSCIYKTPNLESNNIIQNSYETIVSKIEAYCLLLIFSGFLIPIASTFVIVYIKVASHIGILLFTIFQVFIVTLLSRVLFSKIYDAIGEKV
ncbi:MAG: hypothetical protein N3E39_03950 [Candidatus Methanomethylicia archaeon]|nr:hypothetical protein [Candidatus Methanomethylicia archaeon]